MIIPRFTDSLCCRLLFCLARIFVPVIRYKKRRFVTYNKNGKSMAECGLEPNEIHRKLESPLLITPQVKDELRFMGVNLRTGAVLDIYLARCAGCIGRLLLYFSPSKSESQKLYEIACDNIAPITKDADEWHVKDLKIWCLQPLWKWRIQFNGLLRDKNSQSIDYVRFSFIWQPFTDVFHHVDETSSHCIADGISKSSPFFTGCNRLYSLLHQYDYGGLMNGTYSINGNEETEVRLWGIRNRNFGDDLNWSEYHQFIKINCYHEDGTVICVNAVSLYSGLPEMVWGYVKPANGSTHSIIKTDLDLPSFYGLKEMPRILSVRITTSIDLYVLDIVVDKQKVSCLWGKNKEFKMNVSRIDAVHTNKTQALRADGAGTVHFGCQTDFQDFVDLPLPLLQQPSIEECNVQSLIVSFDEISCHNSDVVGGKGSSLSLLKTLNDQSFEVPDGFCITVNASMNHIRSDVKIADAISQLVYACGHHDHEVQFYCKRIHELIIGSSLSSELSSKLLLQLTNQFDVNFNEVKFAVRSSAIGEDGSQLSMAGQLETYLGIKGIDQIIEAVKKCWSSNFSERAVKYRRQNGQSIDVGVGVVIQEMIDADIAGVMFTRDPVTGNPSIISISCNYGLGESVVSSISEPDVIRVKRTFDDKVSFFDATVGAKNTQIVMKDDGGVENRRVESYDVNNCCLSHSQAIVLAEIGILLEKKFGDPRDIEWAIRNGKVYLLQARPITSFYKMTDYEIIHEFDTPFPTDKEMITSGNQREVMPYAVTPLSNMWPFLVFNISCVRGDMFGVVNPRNPFFPSKSVVSGWHRFMDRLQMQYQFNHKNPDSNTLMIRKGFDIAINGRLVDDKDTEMMGIRRYGFMSKYTNLKQMFRIMKVMLRVKQNLKEAKKKFGDWSLNFTSCSNSEQLISLLMNIAAFADCLVIHIQVSLASIIKNTMVLINLAGSSSDVTNDHLQDFATLMSTDRQIEDIESVDIPAALQKLASNMTDKMDVNEFLAMSEKEATDYLLSPSNPVFQLVDGFLTRHGHRCMQEFDLSSDTWSMKPSLLISPLKVLLQLKNSVATRKLTVDEAIDKLKIQLTEKAKKELRKNVIDAKENVSYREQIKSLMTRMLHEYRKGFWHLGTMMMTEGRIPTKDLIFFMTPDEIRTLIRTRSPSIIQRAFQRKKMFPKLKEQKFEEISYGWPVPIVEDSVGEETVESLNDSTLKGTPVSVGTVKSVACVINNLDEAHRIKPGDILVTVSTDIAWSPYFPSLSGLVTEIGGLVSHGAVVAREYGLPCVVGVRNATSFLNSGDILLVDGTKGLVTKLK
ncbi:Uncharacterised protein g5350 [Pycnogonum litorale]